VIKEGDRFGERPIQPGTVGAALAENRTERAEKKRLKNPHPQKRTGNDSKKASASIGQTRTKQTMGYQAQKEQKQPANKGILTEPETKGRKTAKPEGKDVDPRKKKVKRPGREVKTNSP